ncbi:ribonuclease H-like domain-containing protein [Hypoxylon fuscum]|nr:ribonuclease H-like domain-containing protein [Hypoxylon fuscum]
MDNDDGVWRPNGSLNKDVSQWPLSYSLRPPPEGGPPRKWWSYRDYRGPQNRPPQIIYCNSKSRSEIVARTFLHEPVLGFDMEWPYDPMKDENSYTRLQDKVALIQIACERRIALFHIALHDGQTSEEIIAPSLRHIIESASVIKAGVAILNADFRRLKEHFQLQPQGAFELSHLHNLITHGPQNPEQITTRLCKLSTQVQCHLGLPLDKGNVRISNWSLPLNDGQRAYAATDAYAGYMLFHCMNSKRLKMIRVPPIPKLAESYLPFELVPPVFVQLEQPSDRAEDVAITALQFFKPPEKRRPKGLTSPDLLLAEPEKSLYKKLFIHRLRRKIHGVSPVVSSELLQALAQSRPSNERELLLVSGVNKGLVDEYGADWLRIIAKFEANHGSKPSGPSISNTNRNSSYAKGTQLQQPQLSPQLRRLALKRKMITNARHSREALLSGPLQSTGLSFELAETSLDASKVPAVQDKSNDRNESNDCSASGT